MRGGRGVLKGSAFRRVESDLRGVARGILSKSAGGLESIEASICKNRFEPQSLQTSRVRLCLPQEFPRRVFRRRC